RQLQVRHQRPRRVLRAGSRVRRARLRLPPRGRPRLLWHRPAILLPRLSAALRLVEADGPEGLVAGNALRFLDRLRFLVPNAGGRDAAGNAPPYALRATPPLARRGVTPLLAVRHMSIVRRAAVGG